MRKISTIFCCLFLLIAVPTVQAEFRIATISVNRILNESKEAQSKKKELDDLMAKAKKKVDEKRNALQATEKKIKEGKIEENSEEGKAFKNDAREFGRFLKDTETEMRNEFLKFNKSLTEKTLNLVAKYAKSNQIDLVIDKGENGRSPVLYGNADTDITDIIVKQMNQ